MTLVQATKSYFLRWRDFQGRSSRSEYWWAVLSVFVISSLLGFFVGFFGALAGLSMTTIQLLIVPIQIFLTIASVALVIRRLHDTDRSGWWYLIFLTIIGIFVLVIWYCQKGTEGENRFGKDPLLD